MLLLLLLQEAAERRRTPTDAAAATAETRPRHEAGKPGCKLPRQCAANGSLANVRQTSRKTRHVVCKARRVEMWNEGGRRPRPRRLAQKLPSQLGGAQLSQEAHSHSLPCPC